MIKSKSTCENSDESYKGEMVRIYRRKGRFLIVDATGDNLTRALINCELEMRGLIHLVYNANDLLIAEERDFHALSFHSYIYLSYIQVSPFLSYEGHLKILDLFSVRERLDITLQKSVKMKLVNAYRELESNMDISIFL